MAREYHFNDLGRRYGGELIGDADPRTAYRDETARRANLAREAGATQRLAGSDRATTGHSRNFLPVEQRLVQTTPAGVSAYLAPLQGQAPAAQDAHQVRIAAAQAARQIAASTQLSGSHEAGHSRFAPGGAFDADLMPGQRHSVDWQAVGDYGT